MSNCIYQNQPTKESLPILSSLGPFYPVKIEYCKQTEAQTRSLLRKFLKSSKIQPNIDYLIKLIKDSGIYLDEIKMILKKGGIRTLWIYCVLRKARDKNLMSKRYGDFLDKISDLIKKGSIRIEGGKPQVNPIGEAYDQFEYDSKTNTLKYYFSNTSATAAEQMELSLIHECYHAYQDFNKERGRDDVIEAGAYLAQADFETHAFPKNKNTSWVRIIDMKGRYGFVFDVPASLTEKLSVNSDSKKLSQNLQKIAQNYSYFLPFTFVLNSGVVERESQKLLATGPQYREIANRIAEAFKRQKYQLQFAKEGTWVKMVKPPALMVQYLSVLNAVVKQHWDTYKKFDYPAEKKVAQDYIDKFFGRFKEHSQLGSGLHDSNKFDGIK